MKLHTLNRVAIAAAMALGLAGAATAVPTFTINPDVLADPVTTYSPFDATLVNGTSSELLHMDSLNKTATADGWANFSSFSNGSTIVDPDVTGLRIDYGLYLTFSLADKLVSGTFGQAGSVYDLTKLDFQVWGDLGKNTTFVNADAATATEATVGGVTTDDILLAFGWLVPGQGVAGFDSGGGAYINALNYFAVCTGANTADIGGTAIVNPGCLSGDGESFFAAPNPFYTLAFSAFNNTGQGPGRNADSSLISITQAVGIVDFKDVPEPGSLALLGLGLAGLGFAQRRRSQVK